MFKNLSNKITCKIGRQILVTKKHSPTVLVATGIVGVVATVVLASKATLKLDEVLKEAEHDSETAKNLHDDKYSEEDRKKDLGLVRVKAAIKIVKLYAPSVVVGVASIGCITGAHVILNKRNIGLTAAYAAVDKGFREYRSRVVQELGEEKDLEFRHGLVDREIAVETDEGPVVKTVKGVDPTVGMSMYARCFDKTNRNWKTEPSYNQMWLRAQQNYANDLLNARGHLFLNEVYKMLGMKHTSAGSVVGWIKGNRDSYVDFGIFNNDEYMGMMFACGSEKSVWLDFNVDGVIYDKIEE